MKWYCVITTFDDRGNVTANIVDCIEADKKPESTFTETRYKDIYTDWFQSKEEAEEFVKQSYNA